jgi:hypothetical protein
LVAVAELAVDDGSAERADSPAAWESEHPHAREDLQAAEQALDRAIQVTVDARLQRLPGHVTRVLGDRPEQGRGDELVAWDKAARAIEIYRVTHQVDPAEPYAIGSGKARTGMWEQRRDWRAAGERVLDAHEDLGIAKQGHGPPSERFARVQGLIPEADRERALDRGHGFEL